MVRNCHAGLGGANVRRDEVESQHESVMRMNDIIARVAVELCVPVLDVYALDAAAGFRLAGRCPARLPPADHRLAVGGVRRAARSGRTGVLRPVNDAHFA